MNIKKIILCLIVFLLVLFGTWKYAHAQIKKNEELYQSSLQALEIAQKERIERMSVKQLIDYIAPQYGANPALLKKVIWCESGFRTDVSHDNSHGWGTTGFHRATFNDWKVKFGREELIYESNFDQIVLMSIAFEKGEWYRNKWSTYVAYKNGGTYSFYSNLMGRHYTVTCR